MTKSNKFTWIAFGFLAILGIFGMWMIGKGQDCLEVDCSKYTYMGWFAVAFAIIIVIYLKVRDRAKPKIAFSKVKEAYIKAMDQKECISINPLAETFRLTEEGKRYVFVLRDYVDDIATYYMCEADMYEGNFGRGFGQKTTKEVEATYWYQTRKKLDVAQILNKELQTQAIRNLMLKTKQQEAMLKGLNKTEQEFSG